jgi:hypothetical protein
MKLNRCHDRVPALAAFALLGMVLLAIAPKAWASSDDEPICYTATPVDDPVAQLQRRLERGEVKLQFSPEHGYLESVLQQLKVPVSSQTLVFSKTSFQRNLISPRKPRALYFNDENYIGWVRGGAVLEIASTDARQGTVFYTLKQEKSEKPRLVRQTFDCLQCHESGMTHNVPGLLMRSVYPDDEGQPILSAGTYVTTDQSPLSERWGGWYVTGKTGRQHHMGNSTIDDEEHADQFDFGSGCNLTDLSKLVKTAPYLSKHSDIVALMVLEHQTNLHNLITRANYETRIALRDCAALNKALGDPPGHLSESTLHRIKSVCEPLVKAMLFSGEAKLTDAVEGTSDFTKEFAARGPADSHGRSLRQFDLHTRLFKYPCSYLIYSEQFDALPDAAKNYVYHRLSDVLTGEETGREYSHLTSDDCRSILQILRETKKGLPEYFGR